MISWIKSELQRIPKWPLFLSLAITIPCFIIAVPEFLKLVEFLGHRIPQKDVQADYLKGLAWAIFLGLTILIWPVHPRDKKALLWVWSVKCFVMLGLMLFYEYHYQTDAFAYFSVSKQSIGEWEAIFSAGPNFPVSTIIWLQNILLTTSFHAAKVSFGMIGLIAIYIFYRAAVLFLKQEKIELLYVFTFFPSILFWSSIIGKEPLVLLFITIYCYGAIKWIRTKSLSSAIIMLLGVAIAASIRPWLGLILALPAFIITVPTIFRKNFKTKIIVLSMLILVALFSTNKVMLSFGIKSSKDLPNVANQKFNGFARGGSTTVKSFPIAASKKIDTFASSASVTAANPPIAVLKEVKAPGKSGSFGDTNKIKYSSLKDMIIFVPRGMFTALFRPLPGEVNNVFGFLAGIEGAFLLILFGLAMKRMRWRELSDPIIIWAILLIVVWAAAYGFISYNLGTVCRYRLQILPVFLGLLMYLSRRRDSLIMHKDK